MTGIKYLSQIQMIVRPVEDNHLVRLSDMVEYVASMSKLPVRVVLDEDFDGTYDSGTMTLTQNTASEIIIDGITVALGDRILVTGQSVLSENGIYTITTLGVSESISDAGDGVEAVLTRASDFDESIELINGIIVPVSEGEVNALSRWKLIVDATPAELGVSDIKFFKDTVVTARVVQEVFSLEGDDVQSVYEIPHGMGSMNVVERMYEESTGATVIADFVRIDDDTAEIKFGVPLGTGNDIILSLMTEVSPV